MWSRIVVALIAAFCPVAIYAQEKMSGAEIIERSQAAFYYPGSDMKARVVMELINADGKKRTRTLTMLRKNIPGGREQRYYLYFHEPGDVRRTAFLARIPMRGMRANGRGVVPEVRR